MTPNDRSPERWHRIRELFEQAIERDAAGLDAWLAGEANDDPELRREVASLLAHHTRAGAFLLEPLSSRVPDLLAAEGPFAEGTTVGPYRIVRELGRGGMGRVYLASDTRLDRMVALKAVSPHLTSDTSHRERLRREAKAAAALTHPGICTVYALEELDEGLFIASEFVDGRTLRDEMRTGSLPSAGHLVRTAQELAAALASAHAKGITHRDLKPENVMRAADGHLKILDFGLARFDLQGPEAGYATQPGTLIGTPGYMAPEQLNAGTVDARSDVFAFGVLIYELACGVHPFHAATPLAQAGRVLEGAVRPLESHRPDVHPVLGATVERCLRKEPSERFASALDVALALAATGGQWRPGTQTRWWRAHHVIVIALYLAASVLAWQIKEWTHGLADPTFVVVGVAAAIAGIFRGHLVFTERMHPALLRAERQRAKLVTLTVDILMAGVLATEGAFLAARRPLASVLTIALAVAIALARIVLEPATTLAAFGSETNLKPERTLNPEPGTPNPNRSPRR